MAIWIALILMSIIVFILGIFYLVNSIRYYEKWIAPAVLLVISLCCSVICGINIYKQYRSSQDVDPLSVQKKAKGPVINDGFTTINEKITQDKNEQNILKDLQTNFAKVGNVSLNSQERTFSIDPTNSKNAKAIDYTLQNPPKAQNTGYLNLTNGIQKTSIEVSKALGTDYTLQLLKPNSSEVIYAAKNGKIIKNVVAQ